MSEYHAADFARDIENAMRSSGDAARQRTLEAMQQAIASPVLLEGTEDQAKSLEYHLLRTPSAAIKVFTMRPEHGAGVPHDHGGLWGCYGTYKGAYLMETYEAAENDNARVEPLECTIMGPGAIRFMDDHAIHRVWAEEGECTLLTVYNGDLNSVDRRIFDVENNRVIRDRSRWEERIVGEDVFLFEI